jgi:hypothetical protein
LNREDLDTAVLFDLDSTLGDTRHRWHLSPMANPLSSWEAYCGARMGDVPLLGPVTLARLLYPHHQIHICSGSEASSGDVTRSWLNMHRVPYDVLKQRPEGDRRKNHVLKISYIEELHARGTRVVLFLEDHPEVAEEIPRATGVPVLGVNPFYPEDLEQFRSQVFDGAGGGL